jgi:hypothetical protein
MNFKRGLDALFLILYVLVIFLKLALSDFLFTGISIRLKLYLGLNFLKNFNHLQPIA